MKKYLALMVIVGFLFMSVPSAKAVTLEDLQKDIQSLKEQVNSLKIQLAGKVLGASTPSVSSVENISRSLGKGSIGDDVKVLQDFLKEKGYLKVKLTTNSFGVLTEQALRQYQKDQNIKVTGKTDADTLLKIGKSRNLSLDCNTHLPSLQVVAPNGGQQYIPGQQVSVTVKSCNIPSGTQLDYSLSYLNNNNLTTQGWGSSGVVLNNNSATFVFNLPDSGAFQSSADFPLPYGNVYKVGVRTDYGVDGGIFQEDYSDNFFSINNTNISNITDCIPGVTPPSITVLAPNGGETFVVGEVMKIKWKSCNLQPNQSVRALLYYQNQSSGATLVVTGDGPTFGNGWTINDGAENITVPQLIPWNNSGQPQPGLYYKISVDVQNPPTTSGISDFSDNLFTINAANSSTVCGTNQSVVVDGVTYSLNPTGIIETMTDGQGNKNFSFTINQSVPNVVGVFSVYGYGIGFPTYGTLGTQSGGILNNMVVNRYFNDGVLSANNGSANTYTGCLPVRIYNSNTIGSGGGFMYLNLNLTVNP